MQLATGSSPDPRSNMWDLIAWYLRICRTQRGQSLEALSKIAKTSRSSLSRVELGETRLDGTQARLIDKAWDTHGLFTLLVWYATLGHDPQWFAEYVKYEQQARMIRIYEANVIPGLVQTEDYARALFLTGDAPNTEELLQERMQRQVMLDGSTPPMLTMILSQNALEWPVGSPEIMRAQLARLLELSERPRISIRVVPRTWEVAAYPGLDGSFQLISGLDFGELAYTDAPEGGRLVSTSEEVLNYGIRYDQISSKALPEEQSRNMLRQVMESFE